MKPSPKLNSKLRAKKGTAGSRYDGRFILLGHIFKPAVRGYVCNTFMGILTDVFGGVSLEPNSLEMLQPMRMN